MKALVVAGGIAQAALILELKSRGIYTILADRNPKAVARPYADAFFPVSTLDEEGIYQLALKEKVDLVITACADQVLLITAKVSERLGLPCYIDYNTATLVSDKKYMKDIFVKNSIPTSRYAVMSYYDKDELRDFQFPMIVKPVDSYSSRGVRKVINYDEMKAAFDEAVEISRTKTAIIEEFCDGEELTVDVYVENGKAHILAISINDKIADKDRFVIYRTKNPAPVSEDVKSKIQNTAQKIADAFNLKDSPMLIQLISVKEEILFLFVDVYNLESLIKMEKNDTL